MPLGMPPHEWIKGKHSIIMDGKTIDVYLYDRCGYRFWHSHFGGNEIARGQKKFSTHMRAVAKAIGFEWQKLKT